MLIFLLFRLKERPDFIIVSSLSLLSVISGLILSKIYKCKFIFEVRDIWPLTIVEEGGFSNKNPFVYILSVIERIGYLKADLIVGTMPNLKEHVTKVSSSKKKVICIPMGFEEKDYIGEKNLLSKVKLNSQKFNLLYAGTIGITNALDPFFKAALALESNPNINFIIMGDGDLKESYYEKYGHLPNISFIPKVSKKDVHMVLKQASVLYLSVHTSNVWRYGQSMNKVIDYMLSGRPIICSYDGFQSMINEANCGTFIPPGNFLELVNIIQTYANLSIQELDSLGEKGRQWVIEQRKYRDLAEEYLNHLEML